MEYLRSYFVLCIILFCLFLVAFNVSSQNQRQLRTKHYRKGINRNTGARVPPPLYFRNRQADFGTANITVTYDDGFDQNMAAKIAFQYAVDLLKIEIASDVEIRVDAVFQPIDGDTLGASGSIKAHKNFNHGKPDVWYSDAIADKLSGVDLNPGQPDILAEFNSNIDFYFDTDGNTPANRFDFVTLVLHELIHGIGFVAEGSYDTSTGEGSIRNGGFSGVYDWFVVNGSGRSITVFSDPSVDLGKQVTSDNLFWNGLSGKVAYGGKLPKLYAPIQWEEGASYSHLDETAYPPGDANTLMTPDQDMQESTHDIGPIVRGMLEDIGWTVNPSVEADEATTQNITGNGAGEFVAPIGIGAGIPIKIVFDTIDITTTVSIDEIDVSESFKSNRGKIQGGPFTFKLPTGRYSVKETYIGKVKSSTQLIGSPTILLDPITITRNLIVDTPTFYTLSVDSKVENLEGEVIGDFVGKVRIQGMLGTGVSITIISTRAIRPREIIRYRAEVSAWLTSETMISKRGGSVLVGDVNGDGNVDILDLVTVASQFGQDGENLSGDVTGDNQVNIFDLVMVASHFGGTLVAPAPLAKELVLSDQQNRNIQSSIMELRRKPSRSITEERVLNLLKAVLPDSFPVHTQLLQNYPNPFNPETWMPFVLNYDSEVKLTIYDMEGNPIRSISVGYVDAGSYVSRSEAIYWDGKADTGEKVASGTYFYTLKTHRSVFTQKMIILK